MLYGVTNSLTSVIEIRLLEANTAGPVHEVFTTTSVSTAVFNQMVQIRVKLIPADSTPAGGIRLIVAFIGTVRERV